MHKGKKCCITLWIRLLLIGCIVSRLQDSVEGYKVSEKCSELLTYTGTLGWGNYQGANCLVDFDVYEKGQFTHMEVMDSGVHHRENFAMDVAAIST